MELIVFGNDTDMKASVSGIKILKVVCLCTKKQIRLCFFII